ncbi:MAG: signal peptidase I [Ignavibacteria bacterium]|nr:signal peptidase I [Ignavibacteria bacterium]
MKILYKSLKFLFKIILLIVAILFIKTYLFNVYRVFNSSMEPTLKDGDIILINKTLFEIKFPISPFNGYKKIKNGDVIIFKLPKHVIGKDPDQSWNIIKRCIGRPGDSIEINGENVFVNKKLFQITSVETDISIKNDSSYSLYIPEKGDTIYLNSDLNQKYNDLILDEGHKIRKDSSKIFIDGVETGKYIVKNNYYFMMGDNRNNSFDSRNYGFVPEQNLIGTLITSF